MPVYGYLQGRGGTFELTKTRCTVGRKPENDLVLSGRSVSSFHAAIEQGASGWVLRDLGSLNGTFVNDTFVKGDGVTVPTHVPLPAGAVVRFGYDAATYIFSEGPTPPTPGTQTQTSPPGGAMAATASAATNPYSPLPTPATSGGGGSAGGSAGAASSGGGGGGGGGGRCGGGAETTEIGESGFVGGDSVAAAAAAENAAAGRLSLAPLTGPGATVGVAGGTLPGDGARFEQLSLQEQGAGGSGGPGGAGVRMGEAVGSTGMAAPAGATTSMRPGELAGSDGATLPGPTEMGLAPELAKQCADAVVAIERRAGAMSQWKDTLMDRMRSLDFDGSDGAIETAKTTAISRNWERLDDAERESAGQLGYNAVLWDSELAPKAEALPLSPPTTALELAARLERLAGRLERTEMVDLEHAWQDQMMHMQRRLSENDASASSTGWQVVAKEHALRQYSAELRRRVDGLTATLEQREAELRGWKAMDSNRELVRAQTTISLLRDQVAQKDSELGSMRSDFVMLLARLSVAGNTSMRQEAPAIAAPIQANLEQFFADKYGEISRESRALALGKSRQHGAGRRWAALVAHNEALQQRAHVLDARLAAQTDASRDQIKATSSRLRDANMQIALVTGADPADAKRIAAEFLVAQLHGADSAVLDASAAAEESQAEAENIALELQTLSKLRYIGGDTEEQLRSEVTRLCNTEHELRAQLAEDKFIDLQDLCSSQSEHLSERQKTIDSLRSEIQAMKQLHFENVGDSAVTFFSGALEQANEQAKTLEAALKTTKQQKIATQQALSSSEAKRTALTSSLEQATAKSTLLAKLTVAGDQWASAPAVAQSSAAAPAPAPVAPAAAPVTTSAAEPAAPAPLVTLTDPSGVEFQAASTE